MKLVEVEHMKRNLEKNRKKLQIDFEHWWHDYYLQNQLGIVQNQNKEQNKLDYIEQPPHYSIDDVQTQNDIEQFYSLKNNIFQRQAMIAQICKNDIDKFSSHDDDNDPLGNHHILQNNFL